jgi:hypothetical protein
MEVHAISSVKDSDEGLAATWVYRESFHANLTLVRNRYGERPYKPLQLIRNIALNPPVFFAGISLIVRADIADVLQRFDGVDASPCTWEGIYSQPVDELSLRTLMQEFSPLDERYGQMIRDSLRKPDSTFDARQYVEVIVPRHEELAHSFDNDVELLLPSPSYKRMPPIPTCKKLHQLYPATRAVPYYLVNDAIYSVLKPYVETPQLFTVRHFPVAPSQGRVMLE